MAYLRRDGIGCSRRLTICRLYALALRRHSAFQGEKAGRQQPPAEVCATLCSGGEGRTQCRAALVATPHWRRVPQAALREKASRSSPLESGVLHLEPVPASAARVGAAQAVSLMRLAALLLCDRPHSRGLRNRSASSPMWWARGRRRCLLTQRRHPNRLWPAASCS